MPVHTFERALSKTNVGQLIVEYQASVEEIGNPLGEHRGLGLLEALKRKPLDAGPYSGVSMFEAANRILSDLVILYGVKWLLDNKVFPFEMYTVEYGTEDKTGFDVQASENGKTLKGEAFNVAPSFFQTKKSSMLKKLRETKADYKIVMFNNDAVRPGYKPQPSGNEYFVFVGIVTGVCRMSP